MDYAKYDLDQLIKRINELEVLNKQLFKLKIKAGNGFTIAERLHKEIMTESLSCYLESCLI